MLLRRHVIAGEPGSQSLRARWESIIHAAGSCPSLICPSPHLYFLAARLHVLGTSATWTQKRWCLEILFTYLFPKAQDAFLPCLTFSTSLVPYTHVGRSTGTVLIAHQLSSENRTGRKRPRLSGPSSAGSVIWSLCVPPTCASFSAGWKPLDWSLALSIPSGRCPCSTWCTERPWE